MGVDRHTDEFIAIPRTATAGGEVVIIIILRVTYVGNVGDAE